ncbi:cyclin-G-associated kinase isoform X2 [Drosophila gunungcola]|uniref:cyclin-G-associated kinase isoform X2 n=1 Tax=Drosophila gunungcola TaxID=103775 RepID=UPI0022E68DBA|nr:cyclin-G-associated kinase isoform X2 [Drosophila gunungcola]
MGEFFKSLNFNYFSSSEGSPSANGAAGGGGGGAAAGAGVLGGRLDNDFVGQVVEVAGHRLRIKCVIAEGGYAFVYVAQDVQTGTEYALKRLIGADQQACNAIINEIGIHKQVSGHGNIVAFVGSSYAAPTPQHGAQYLLLTELCKGGSLVDCFRANNAAIDPPLVLRIFYQMARAVACLHSQSPPIAHRDIKIENFLVGNDKQIKLCDFGSATKEVLAPTFEWSANQRNMLEDQLNTVTTPMYRAPEMLDTWSNNPIGPKADVWALSCILYFLCYRRHPYEDGGKLRIINANYILPPDPQYQCFRDIIRGCFKVNPAERLDIAMVLERLAAIAETQNWSLKGPLDLHGVPIDSFPAESPARKNSVQSEFYTESPSTAPHAAPPSATAPSSSNGHGSLLSSLRGGAGTLFKNIKDTSTKVMQTMQQSIARTDLDISHITSRILVMPCPSDGFESAYKTNNIEDVRLSLESRFAPQKISIYNFGQRTVPRLPPPVRTVEAGSVYGCPQAHAPNLQGLFTVSADMYNFLNADPKSIVIVQTGDSGGCSAATVICALLMYADLLQEPEDAVQVFAVKRHTINLRPSEFRYLYYFGDILRPTPLLPHYKNTNLVALSCQPVPRMTKARDGCRIYMEVYCNETLLLSTLQDYEKMRLHLAGPGKIVLPINLTVCGDVTVVLYHARKGMVRPQGLKICQFQVNTGFIPEPETLITFTSQDLDDLPDPEQVTPGFCVSLSLTVTDSETPPSHKPPWLPAKPSRSPAALFSSDLEFAEMLDNFVTKPAVARNDRSPTQPITKAPADPFADIANLASGLNINFNRSTLSGKSPVGSSPQPTQFSSPTHRPSPSSQPQASFMQTPTQPQPQPQPMTTSARAAPQPQSAPAQSRPDYSRAHFDAPKPAQQAGPGGTKGSDIFADILGQQGYSFGSKMNQGPRSINEMRKEDLVRDMDPKKVRIMEWTDGKKNNIRALLCSMHTVLWDNAKWQRCEMSTMVTPVEVKKAYRRACLAVHPDKHNGTENEEIAKLIFMELNNAWTDFENDATQQNMFNA